MATATCTAAVAPGLVLFTTDRVHKGKISNIAIDNQSAVIETIGFWDLFTTDASFLAAAAPIARLRKQVTVAAGQTISLEGDDVKDIDILGALWAIASAAQALCVITVGYSED